jgi:3-methyladenine DNA glycosylase AlkD
MTTSDVLKELATYGDLQTKNTLMKHGAREPFYGVKVADLKKILKKTKKNHHLSLELYATGNSDAMYLAGLMADETKISKEQLNEWVEKAYWYYLSEYAVPWVAAETTFGFELGMEWIQSDKENIASAGWATLSNFASVRSDEELNIEVYSKLLDIIVKEIQTAQNRVKYCMNGFVIATAAYINELTDKSILVAEKIGKVEVQLGGSGCKVPLASDYIQNLIEKGRVGKKRKSARC